MTEARFLDELRDRLTLSSVIGRDVKLIRAGREFKACCPFHTEKTPSFTINDDKGFYHCFGCGAHGDVIAYTMQAKHLSFPEAVERLAGEVGLAVPRATPEEAVRARRQATVMEILDRACGFYEQALWSDRGRRALDYLHRRGLSDDTIWRFRLGWAPPGNALLRRLRADHLDLALLIEAGVVRSGESGAHDVFRDRVMFPITDRQGRVIAFGGRLMGEGQPKYLNSADSPQFRKGEVLYGAAQARAGMAQAGRAVVVEGYMDVIASHQAGVGSAVAPLGTALTLDQASALWRRVPEITLCLDGDAAGQAAMVRAGDLLLPLVGPDRRVSIVQLPSGQDPDGLIALRGAEVWESLIAEPGPLIDLVWSAVANEARSDTPERVVAWERDLQRRAGVIRDAATRRAYLGEFRRRFSEHGPPAPLILLGRSTRKAAPGPDSDLLDREWKDARIRAGDGSVREWLSRKHAIPWPDLVDRVGGIGLATAKPVRGKARQGEDWHSAGPLPLWVPDDGGAGMIIIPAWSVGIGGGLCDLIAWDPRTDELYSRTGVSMVLGQCVVDEIRAFQALGLPQTLKVAASPLSWLKRWSAGEACILVIDWKRVWTALGGLSGLIAETVEVGEKLSRWCKPPRVARPEIFVEDRP